MADIVLFTPLVELDAAENLQRFIDMCREKLTVFGANLSFQDNVWDVTDSVAIKGRGKKRVRITFSNAATVGTNAQEIMREPFLSFAKAYLRYMHGMRPTKVIHNRVAALRAIEAALSERGEAPSPVRIDSHILNRAAQIVVDRFSDGAAYRVAGQIELMATFMAENRLLAIPVRWRNPVKRPSTAVRVGKEFDERRAKKMPSSATLEALPQIFRAAVEPVDVITASVAAVLLAAPDRIGEVLSLPECCEVHEPMEGGKDAYGLRWWPAKGAEPMVKWLVPSLATVVKDALRKIRSVTEEARRIAKWYERYPCQIYLTDDVSHLRGREWLSLAEIAEIMGFRQGNAAQSWCKAEGIKLERRHGLGKLLFARFLDVERSVLGMLPSGFPVFDKSTGLKYSDALFIMRRNELGAQRGTYRCMIEPIGIGQINTRLGSRSNHGLQSIFDRFGFVEPDGSPIVVTSHQFRHYLNTLAQAGGLSQLDIAKWSGRRDVRQNEAYDHVTSEQMLQKIRGAVGEEQMFGSLAELPKKVMIRRDEFARLVIPTAHTTDLGYCIHDYTASPCQLHLDCINCQDLVCVKGDVRKTAMLRRRLVESRDLLCKAETAREDGYSGSDRWIEHHRSTVERYSKLNSIMEDPTVPEGAVIQLAPPIAPTRIKQEKVHRLPVQTGDAQVGLPAKIRALMEE